jgi:hypothetical protein
MYLFFLKAADFNLLQLVVLFYDLNNHYLTNFHFFNNYTFAMKGLNFRN